MLAATQHGRTNIIPAALSTKPRPKADRVTLSSMADTSEAPRIEERTDIRQTLIGEIVSANIDNNTDINS
jgi:hypothetical protein